jgi:hypothetical protein
MSAKRHPLWCQATFKGGSCGLRAQPECKFSITIIISNADF